jgi:hypothetical protein
VERPIRQEAHLRVTAVACVPAQSLGQRDYLRVLRPLWSSDRLYDRFA